MTGARSIWAYVVPRRAPLAAILAFSIGVAFAFSPNVLEVYGIHNDYEMLNFKSSGFFHPEAEALFAIARPVAGLLTNLTVLPVQVLSDYRWMRIFSILTVCLTGSLLIAICIHRLRTGVVEAVAIALATFLVPPFIYSVLNSSAWSPHLLSVLLVMVAYGALSASNVLLPSFHEALQRRDAAMLLRQAWAYARLKPVWAGCIVYQLALFDYPPNAMLLAVLPVVAVLFARLPVGYRTLIAVRDIGFVGANIVIFTIAAKLVYLPLVRLFTSMGTGAPKATDSGALAARITATYRFDFNFDPMVALERFAGLLKVAGDLWFLPQVRFHVVLGIVVALAFVLAQLVFLMRRRDGEGGPVLSRVGLAAEPFSAWSAFAVCAACLAVAGSAIVASATGFITYRTITVPTAILGVVALFAIRGIADWAMRLVGGSAVAAGRVADIATGLLACAAVGGNFYMNDLTLRLARNEFTYFSNVVREAAAKKAKVIVIVDPRHYYMPEDIPAVDDQKGRAVPPYELGCLSGYCMQSGSIVQIAARELGYPPGTFQVYNVRDDEPVPGLSCEIIADKDAPLPATLPEQTRSPLRWYQSLGALCVTYSLDWHDIGRDLRR